MISRYSFSAPERIFRSFRTILLLEVMEDLQMMADVICLGHLNVPQERCYMLAAFRLEQQLSWLGLIQQ